MPDKGARVADGIYIGSLETVTRTTSIYENDIGFIVNLSGTEYYPKWRSTCSDGMVLHILMEDIDVDISNIDIYMKKFAAAVSAIEKARQEGKNVMVNCAAGINRSATAIGFYLIENGWTYEEVLYALESANATRHTLVLTNPSFRYLLKSYCSAKRAMRERCKIFEKIRIRCQQRRFFLK